MNKKDLPLLILLIALWVAWPHVYKRYIKPPTPEVEETQAGEEAASAAGTALAGEEGPAIAPAAEASTDPVVESESATVVAEPTVTPDQPERTVILSCDRIDVTLSSYGGVVKEAVLKDHREDLQADSGPVRFDFSEDPALAYRNLVGLSEGYAFAVETSSDGQEARFERTTSSGLRLIRTMRFEGSVLRIFDEMSNTSGTALTLPAYEIEVAPMRDMPSERRIARMLYLGVDTLPQAGDGVKHWGKKINKWFGEGETANQALDMPSDWVAVKNKFFVQILTPIDGFEDCRVRATRDLESKEVQEVSASGELAGITLEPGQLFAREYDYYVGAKKYTQLKVLGMHQDQIMELGWFGAIGKVLLKVLNFIHDHMWPFNYGIAIMLLTIIIRVVFWPLTHKGTENMKRMQELQPQIKELREKLKDNAQKQQQEMMALYKKHKVNPMMGCLPMLIQIPVFIGLFYVLRSAVELRFAEFLWVQDLSEPERIMEFGFAIPLLGWDALNILPLIMTLTTVVQQRLTPTAGDPSQQKMMAMMPVIMLIFLYNFASGLVLYWTTNNVLMIAQQLMQRRKAKK